MTIEEALNRLADVVNTLAGSIVTRNTRIGALLQAAGKHDEVMANLEKQWQAYIKTLPRR